MYTVLFSHQGLLHHCRSSDLIPVDPSFFSLHGLHKVRETIELLRDEIGHEIHIRILAKIGRASCRERV